MLEVRQYQASVCEAGAVPVDGAGARHRHRRRPPVYRDALKRPVDVALTLLLAPLAVPLVLLMAGLVMRDGGPAFFAQNRVGRGGRIFRCWKLRTMVPDAEARLSAHLAECPAARAEWAVRQKLRRDPRITRLGRLLRRTSLDELPQLWNVLRGHMSLIGPRPITPAQVALYSGCAYYTLRPGLTGLWQIRDRNGDAFASRVRFDEEYGRRVSLLFDLQVLVGTVRVLLRATGE